MRAEPSPSPAAVLRGAVDPRVVRSRALIVEAATAHFLEHGYLAANLDAVARSAGVSKRTIYNLYGDKESLFRAVAHRSVDVAERFARAVVADLGDSDDVAAGLRAVALALAEAITGGRVLALRRLLIGEAHRFPDLARDYHERAPQRVLDALADALRRFSERGLLAVEDPALAAEHFAFLTIGATLDRALFDTEPTSPTEVEARALAGVEAFLQAYRRG